ncbi:hypothetical protein [Brevundimonas sp.]|uniref:hypothetical protein n=1 Tax=Brevundimonas sp. TaxID=1871086 RepID=UPI001A2CB2DF|nr:hypothetical protein [Brevundimonas sp.]MBJ7483774.1 hypothetical protein [Brevundimonas sp.]
MAVAVDDHVHSPGLAYANFALTDAQLRRRLYIHRLALLARAYSSRKEKQVPFCLANQQTSPHIDENTAQQGCDDARSVHGMPRHWDLAAIRSIEDVLDHGLMTAAALPAGPVYLTLPREVLSAPSEPHVVEAKPLAPTTRAAHDPDAIRRLAALIDAAECPLLVTSASGRDPTTVQPLGDLCSRFGIGILEAKSRYVCAAADDPYHLGQSVHPYLGEADLLICLETDVPGSRKRESFRRTPASCTSGWIRCSWTTRCAPSGAICSSPELRGSCSDRWARPWPQSLTKVEGLPAPDGLPPCRRPPRASSQTPGTTA